jgi:choline dehydrogenase-like flavoprotein
VVLAASAFETVRLLLNSQSTAFPQGLGNSNGLLGRGILEHIVVSTFAKVPLTAPAVEVIAPSPLKLNAEGTGFYMPPFARFYRQDGSFASYGGQGVISGRSGLFFLGLFGSVAPRGSNRLTLHPTRKDKHGIPIPVIEFGLDEVEKGMLRHMTQALEEMTKAYYGEAGLRRRMSMAMRLREFLRKRSELVIGSSHESGGAPMGSDPASSVVRPDNRLWDAANVLVCDSSCFPSLPPQNPSLTSMALSLRASRLLVQQWRNTQ